MRFVWLFLCALCAFGQAPELPTMTVGVGPSWARGDVHQASADVDLALRLGTSNAYSWSTISTPVATVPPGSPPLSSTITSGLAYVAAQSPDGGIALVTILQAGLSTTQATGTIAPAFTGSVGVAFRWKKTDLYLMPYVKASNPARGDDGSLVSAILQPGFMLIYGFHSK